MCLFRKVTSWQRLGSNMITWHHCVYQWAASFSSNLAMFPFNKKGTKKSAAWSQFFGVSRPCNHAFFIYFSVCRRSCNLQIFKDFCDLVIWIHSPKFWVESNLVWIAAHSCDNESQWLGSTTRWTCGESGTDASMVGGGALEGMFLTCEKCSHHLPIRVWRVYHWYTVITIPNDRPFRRFFTTFV